MCTGLLHIPGSADGSPSRKQLWRFGSAWRSRWGLHPHGAWSESTRQRLNREEAGLMSCIDFNSQSWHRPRRQGNVMRATFRLPRFSLRVLGAVVALIALVINAYCLLGLGCFIYITLVVLFFLVGLRVPSFVSFSLSVVAGLFAISPWLFQADPRYVHPDSPLGLRLMSVVEGAASKPLSLGQSLDVDVYWLACYHDEGIWTALPEAILAFWLGFAVAIGTSAVWRLVRKHRAAYESRRGPASCPGMLF